MKDAHNSRGVMPFQAGAATMNPPAERHIVIQLAEVQAIQRFFFQRTHGADFVNSPKGPPPASAKAIFGGLFFLTYFS